MLELGAQTEEFHEVVGMYAALHGVDLIVCVGTNAEQAFLGAHALAPQRARYFETQETLLSSCRCCCATGTPSWSRARAGCTWNRPLRRCSPSEAPAAARRRTFCRGALSGRTRPHPPPRCAEAPAA